MGHQQSREPENSVADNLKTLQMVFGAYVSMSESGPVTLQEIAAAAPRAHGLAAALKGAED